MEDVRQRLGGMGLSGVTLEQLSGVEWKLGELKARMSWWGGIDDDIDATGLRLGGVHFGASPDKSEQVPLSSIPPIPAPSKGRVGGGGGTAAATANGFNAPSSRPAWARKVPVVGGGDSAGGVSTAAAATGRSYGGVPPPPPPAGSAEALEERLAAERAFGSMDQNSGRVSARRLEELLTLLGIPAAQRGAKATESARAAGLLSAPSFSCQEFVDWYLSWLFKKEGPPGGGASSNGTADGRPPTYRPFPGTNGDDDGSLLSSSSSDDDEDDEDSDAGSGSAPPSDYGDGPIRVGEEKLGRFKDISLGSSDGDDEDGAAVAAAATAALRAAAVAYASRSSSSSSSSNISANNENSDPSCPRRSKPRQAAAAAAAAVGRQSGGAVGSSGGDGEHCSDHVVENGSRPNQETGEGSSSSTGEASGATSSEATGPPESSFAAAAPATPLPRFQFGVPSLQGAGAPGSGASSSAHRAHGRGAPGRGVKSARAGSARGSSASVSSAAAAAGKAPHVGGAGAGAGAVAKEIPPPAAPSSPADMMDVSESPLNPVFGSSSSPGFVFQAGQPRAPPSQQQQQPQPPSPPPSPPPAYTAMPVPPEAAAPAPAPAPASASDPGIPPRAFVFGSSAPAPAAPPAGEAKVIPS
ncbi:unnamed protein product, partial [Ectocarpus sp. 12 AP-2014]